ncbi:hypothetical protein [Ralstonia holmesii]|uniref:hypothetical protein n=1 Tax=Ralstonia holmesii TaxID=3058602 RepID=UPI0028F4CE4D|nr:hypothetical protein [Ralstonia sp. LMG 32967]CAJ0698722.1 hypothetical protein R11007_02869 [Ralstonia sp. LMG 32967]
MKWGHNELASDLAEHLRGSSDRLVWTDMQLGPSGSPRPDVYTVPRSYSRFMPVAYECKVSVADFRRDITAGKWTSYLQFAAGVMFCVPAGLVSKDDIPNGCGLMVRSDSVWRTVKGPTMRAVDNLPRDAWIKLLLDGMHLMTGQRIARDINEWKLEARVREKFGNTMADLVRSRRNAEDRFERDTALLKDAADDAQKLYQEQMAKARERVEKDMAEISAERREMAVALGLPEAASVRTIINRAWEVRQRLDRDNEIRRLKNALDAVQSSLKHALEPIRLPEVSA